jgi:hypothetical protein
MTAVGMDTEWQVTTVNNDSQGLEFVSSFEHKRHPFYGVQFHPEKNAYEWKASSNNPHTANSILVQQYFANFFVGEGKRLVSFFLFLSRIFPSSLFLCSLPLFLSLVFLLSLLPPSFLPSFVLFST